MLFSAGRVVGENAKWMHQNKVANHLLYSNSQTNGVHGYLGMNTYYRHQVSSFTSLEVIAGWNFIHPGNLVHFPTLRPGLRLCLSEGQLCSTSPGLTSAFLLWMPWAEVDSVIRHTLKAGIFCLGQAITWKTIERSDPCHLPPCLLHQHPHMPQLPTVLQDHTGPQSTFSVQLQTISIPQRVFYLGGSLALAYFHF